MKKKRNTLDNVPRGLSMFLTLLGSVPYMLVLLLVTVETFDNIHTNIPLLILIGSYFLSKWVCFFLYIGIKGYSELLNKKPHRLILIGYYTVRSSFGYWLDIITFSFFGRISYDIEHGRIELGLYGYMGLIWSIASIIFLLSYFHFIKKVYKNDLSTIQSTILSYSVKIGVPLALIGVFFRLLKIFVPQIQRVPSDIEVFCILSLLMSLAYLGHALILAIQILYYNNPALKREMILNIKRSNAKNTRI